jgi:uncharacterized protein YbjT (DUF2867 family)
MAEATSVPTVFVCSATGSQGGSVAHQLRSLNWNVRATARNLDSPAAVALKAAGVQLTQGDWDNAEALAAGIAGCDKLFLCLFPNMADLSAETKQAQRIASIAKAAGVKQVVSSTSLGVSQLEAKIHVVEGSFMEKHLLGKKAVEQAVLDAAFESHTFLRPAFFMANFMEPKCVRYPEVRDKGTWTTSLTPETQFPLVDHQDIASLAVTVFQRPEELNGRAFNVASQILPIQRILDELADAAGRPGAFKAIFVSDDEKALGSPNALINSAKTMRSMSEYIDLDELSKYTPLTTFKDYLVREKESVKQTYP